MATFTRWILAHKLVVALAWLIITVVGFVFVQSATNALSQQFSLPGQKAYETNQAILQHYRNGGVQPPVAPVIHLPTGATMSSPQVRQQVGQAFDRARAALPYARVVSYSTTGNRLFISRDFRTTFGLVYLPESLGFGPSPGLSQVQKIFASSTVAGSHFQVTGLIPLQTSSGGGGGPGVLLEALIGGFGALIVLILVFRSFMALIPLLMAVVAIPTTFMLVWALTTVTQVSFIVQFLIALIGLGVAIDYSLLIVMRWREEHKNGLTNEEAVQRAMETAGVAVLFSGTTVAIGLFALVAIPVPFLQSVGYGGMLIPLVTVVVAITLLPVVLASVGTRVDWPRSGRASEDGKYWMAWGRLVVRYRWIAAGVALAILGALLIPLASINIGNPRADSLAKAGPAFQGLKILEQSGIGSGVLTPAEVLVPAGQGQAVASRLATVPGVIGAVAPSGQQWQRAATQIVAVLPSADGSSGAGLATLDRVKSVARQLPGARVGGYAAQGQDFVSAVYGNFPLMIGLIVLVTFILLARAFRSILLPLKAIVLNIMSVGAAWGVMALVWQNGYGSKALWGIAATGSITSWVPLMVFAFLFGLSMDYEVFILSRIREEYDASGSTNRAVVVGIGRTGRLVTSAALILFLSFVSLGTAPVTDIKVLATGLAVGILLDATVIRCLLVPALVSLFGPWNWWLPRLPARLLRVEPSIPKLEEAEEAA